MKKLITLLAAVLLTATVCAQAPQSFKYQAVARDASGDVVADQAVGMQISILQGSITGTAVYVETFIPTTNGFGLINLNIGAGTVVSGDLTTIDWSAGTYFIKIEMDITGGTTYEEYGTSQLLSVPYAMHAKTAENVTGTVTETDPLFTAWDKTSGISITESQITDLDHFTTADETDPVFGAHAANGITSTNITNWTTAYGWGNHADSGYLTSFTETDPIYTAWDKSTGISITESQITDLDHFTTADETDPVFGAHAANGITSTNITNWDAAFSWGDHSTPGYITDGNTGWDNSYEFITALSTETLTNKSGNISMWTNNEGYLTDYTETDPVFITWDKSYNDLTDKPDIIDSINTVIDTTTQFVRIEVDGDINNEIQNLSEVLAEDNLANAQIKEVTDPTDEQDVATKVYVDALEQRINEMQNSLIAVGSLVRDYDGNVYGVITIGTQKWMTENLKTTKYNDGTDIPLVTDGTAWSILTTPGYCWYNNDQAAYGNTYGALYNWYPVETGNLCPDGWHVPSDAEWTQLTDYLGGESVAGGKLKETGTTHWNSPNTGATNESSFTALPGGQRSYNGAFLDIGYNGYWWSSTEDGATYAWRRDLDYGYAGVGREPPYGKKNGFSVRCVRD